ncbi:hypothetical protein L2E82_06318 [Cichorium intybus]|uniref:Uncharacterized protein n=1 Tax=Cichorium intybus TaxID=13427 RepID=A0ACB9HAT2_CICIN|nr:hypothetical protein L2E82_06318 [Cichorium intybus]
MFLDLSLHKGKPLHASSLEHRLFSYFVVPIWYSQQGCVGVIDCYTNNYNDIFSNSVMLIAQLQNVKWAQQNKKRICLPKKKRTMASPCEDSGLETSFPTGFSMHRQLQLHLRFLVLARCHR